MEELFDGQPKRRFLVPLINTWCTMPAALIWHLYIYKMGLEAGHTVALITMEVVAFVYFVLHRRGILSTYSTFRTVSRVGRNAILPSAAVGLCLIILIPRWMADQWSNLIYIHLSSCGLGGVYTFSKIRSESKG